MDIDLRVLEIMDQIKSLNYTVVITGGYIRDFLLDKESGDYDLATNAPLEEVSELFEDIKPKYLNDTLIMLTIKYEGIKVEVSRFREEVYSVDNQLMFSFVDDFSKDAKRRDISINAIAYDDKFIDPLAGMEDLSNRIIRVIGEPSVRFKEDPLRMLRVLRFAATLGFKIEDKALEYIKANFDEALLNANSSKELKLIIKGQYFDEVYEKIPELFEYMSNGKFKNLPIDNRSTLFTDLGLLVYLIYMMRIGSQNKIFEYIQFSKKDIKFALLINNILAELQQKLDYRDVAALFIEYGKDTMLKIYECFSACDFLNQNSVKLIMEVNENSYIRIDELKVSDHDIDSSFTIKEKYEILKDLQSLIVQGKIKNKRAVLLKRIEENY